MLWNVSLFPLCKTLIQESHRVWKLTGLCLGGVNYCWAISFWFGLIEVGIVPFFKFILKVFYFFLESVFFWLVLCFQCEDLVMGFFWCSLTLISNGVEFFYFIICKFYVSWVPFIDSILIFFLFSHYINLLTKNFILSLQLAIFNICVFKLVFKGFS